MAKSPLVSVGLPTFNRAASLALSIKSVLAQEYENLELVISDNASSDDTEGLCSEFSRLDRRIRYIRQPTNRGAFANFVDVLQRAKGEYFMWLSDDDRLDKSYISRCIEVLQSRPDVALACGISRYHDGQAFAFEGVKVDLQQERVTDRVLSFYRKVNDNGTFYGLVRRESLLQNPVKNVLGGDWLLIARLAALGKIVTLNDVIIHRSSQGASSDVSALARSLGLSARRARQPHRTIAVHVARDIILPSEAFAGVGILSRWVLALRSAEVVHRRFVQVKNPLGTFATRVRARIRRKPWIF